MAHDPLDLAALQVLEIRVNGKTVFEVMLTESELPLLRQAVDVFSKALPQDNAVTDKTLQLVGSSYKNNH